MIDVFNRVRSIRLARYIVASVIALGSDLAAFLLLLQIGAMAAAASAAGYCVGILVHWMISSRKVFNDTVANSGIERTKQKAMFVISAFMGLGLTIAIVGAGDLAGIDPRIAKLFAIAISFVLTWVLRNRIIFRNGAEA